MRKVAMAFVLVVVGACGGPDWEGVYRGVLSQSGSCSDGSSVPASGSEASIILGQNGDEVSWFAPCGATVSATVNENTASVHQVTCPATIKEGTTSTMTLNAGTLTLNENSLDVNLSAVVVLSGAVNGTCNLVVSGTLARQE